jgi:hypothetical protein
MEHGIHEHTGNWIGEHRSFAEIAFHEYVRTVNTLSMHLPEGISRALASTVTPADLFADQK